MRLINSKKLLKKNDCQVNSFINTNCLSTSNEETLKKSDTVVAIINANSSSVLKRNIIDNKDLKICNTSSNLFRLCVKNNEYVYARSNDIIMIESCDHLVSVYVAFNDKIKKTIRTNTLKDFLSLLPADQFARISRFCAVNIARLSGGSFINQTFEFDFKISVKLKHALSQHVFKNIGK
jgi:LytTr DNA-binding domain-containing protein